MDTAGKKIKVIKYMEKQLKADRESDQISFYAPRLRAASNLCVAGGPIKKRTCALPVILGLCPKRKSSRFGGIFIMFYRIFLSFDQMMQEVFLCIAPVMKCNVFADRKSIRFCRHP